MPFIKVSNPKSNIWDENPALSLISEFKQFKAIEGTKRSSDILKAIYYIWDPKSDLRDSSLSGEKLIQDVTVGILKEPDFDWDAYEEIRQTYLKFNISKLEALLLTYEKQIEELNSILSKWVATKDDAEKKARLMKLYKDLYQEYISIKAQVDEEREAEEELYAGYTKSKVESYGDGE